MSYAAILEGWKMRSCKRSPVSSFTGIEILRPSCPPLSASFFVSSSVIFLTSTFSNFSYLSLPTCRSTQPETPYVSPLVPKVANGGTPNSRNQ